jgi:GT2 family glycosyltransferase
MKPPKRSASAWVYVLGTSAAEASRTLVYATVLYWQSSELAMLARCVGSLLAQDPGDTAELRIILIDNGCGATPNMPQGAPVELIRLAENRGFAGGHNAGIRRAMDCRADYVLLFNSDAVAEPGCVQELLAAARRKRLVAFAGPLILHETEPDVIESAGHSFDSRTGRHREISRGRPLSSVCDRIREVDAVSGCVMLASCAALEAIGLLDESLFIYFEDMDWCLRARRAGYDVVVAPRARALHLGQGSTGSASTFTTFYSVRNHLVVAARYASPIRGLPVAFLVLCYQLAFIARSRGRRNTKHLVAFIQGAWAAYAGRMGARRFNANRD